jgi:NADH-quinone oxidoreductase subunit H
MSELWTNYIWPVIVIAAQSVLLLVLLLIITAYVLYADRKIWAAVQIRRGPNVVGRGACCNPSPISSSSWSRSL